MTAGRPVRFAAVTIRPPAPRDGRAAGTTATVPIRSARTTLPVGSGQAAAQAVGR